MASVKLIFRDKKPIKSTGECLIFIRVTHNRKQKEFKVGTSKPEDWDFKNNLPRKKHPYYTELLIAIDQKKTEANKIILSLENNNEIFSSEIVTKKLLINRNVTKTTVLTFFQETIDRFNESERIGYANIFKSCSNSLKAFNAGKDFNFLDIDYNFLVQFEEYHTNRGVKPNAIFVYLRTFKTLLNRAMKEEIVGPDYNPFKNYSFAKFRSIKTDKRTLTKGEIDKIVKLDLGDDFQLIDARNYFMFSYFNRGINFIDMAKLKWENINNNRLFYRRSKTQEPFSIELLEPAIEILNYYKNYPSNKKSEYVFPILNETHITAKSIDYRTDKVLKQVNKNLKKIGKAAEIHIKMTTYVARHTFANVLKRGGARISEISEAMGHDSEKTTQIYLDSFENDKIDELTKSILL